jgi:hypothetical protein
MNDDFILRARLHQQEVEKAMPAVFGRETNPISNLARGVKYGLNREQSKKAGEEMRAARFQEKRTAGDIQNLSQGRATTMSQPSTTELGQKDMDDQPLDPAAAVANKDEVGAVATEAAKRAAAAPAVAPAPQHLKEPAVETTGAGGANGNPNMPDTVNEKTTTTLNADGTPQEVKTTTTNTLNPQVQGMAQQFQAGQDMQTLQQGKGAEEQTYMKNRSLMGKIADIGTLGLTSQFGSTGGIARRRANQQSQQQTQQYNQAQGRMNQRNMGISPIMTSFDSQSSAYQNLGEMIAIRKGIQERNTTDNLRRW